MKAWSLILFMAMLVLSATITLQMPEALAASASTKSTPDSILLGGTTAVELCAGSTGLTVTSVSLFGPTGAFIASSTLLPFIATNTCTTWDVPGDFVGSPAIGSIGGWAVAIDTLEGNTLFADFEVSFFVLPESPIGTLAIIGSSLGAMATFAVIRYRKNF